MKNSFLFNKKRRNDVAREESIVVSKDMSTINECYNSLKDNLLFAIEGKKFKVVQVESSHSGEGKTTMICNLAVSLSFNQKKVLIIDLDFRRPRVNVCFGLTNETGLVDYMSDKANLSDIIKKSAYENVDVITRGSSVYNPSYLLASEKFVNFINEIKANYDFVLLDSPPVLQISDYMHISKVADCAIIVAAYRITRKPEIRDTFALMKKTNVDIIGTVLTFVDPQDPYSSYYGAGNYGRADHTHKK